MRIFLLLVSLVGGAHAEEGLALLGIRDNPKQLVDTSPPRTVVTVDVIGSNRLLRTHKITLFDGDIRRLLFNDPFVAPSGADHGCLVVSQGRGVRCVRFSWVTGKQLATSFPVRCSSPRDWITRPVYIIPERLGVLTRSGMETFDLRLGNLFRTKSRAIPLQLDPGSNRLYVLQPRQFAYQPVIAAEPPETFESKPRILYRLPDGMKPERAFFRRDAERVAYVARPRSRRPDADRFVLSVADALSQLLVRRSLPGRLHDLRWLDDERILFTTTQGATTSIHTLVVGSDRLTTRKLPARYLAPPEIVPTSLLGASARG